jgi:hypothetical protein
VILQVVPRIWPPDAVHDTVDVVVRGAAFQRSLQSSLAERLMRWLGEWMGRVVHFLDGKASVRAIALGIAAMLALLVVARLVLAARARDDDAFAASGARRARPGGDSWRDADRFAADGRFEEAAHALYRGVLASLAQTERVRLDPSKTSGDYARELRARGSASHAPFRAFGRRFEVAVYGHGGCDAALIDDLRRLASPFAPRARAA